MIEPFTYGLYLLRLLMKGLCEGSARLTVPSVIELGLDDPLI